MAHLLNASFILFPDTSDWYHGLLWQLNNHLPTTGCVVLVYTTINKNAEHFLKLKRAVIETMGKKQKTSMHTPSVTAALSDSTCMEMVVQLAKKSMIQIRYVLKQYNGWQIADSSCPLI